MLIGINALWEYQLDALNTVPADPQAQAIPSNGWGFGYTPMGTPSAIIPEFPAVTSWEVGSSLWLRKGLTLASKGSVTLAGSVSNSLLIYWDNVLVAAVNRENAARGTPTEWNVVIPESLCGAGVHVLALYAVSNASSSPYISVKADYTRPMLPMQPQAPATETLAWKTDTVVSHDGSEDRLKVRRNPRQQFTYTYPAESKYGRSLLNMVSGARVKEWILPLWTQVTKLGQLNAGEHELMLTTVNHEYRAGSFALIWQSPERWQVVGVDEVKPDRVILSGITESFTIALVMPARIARIARNPDRRTDGYSSLYDIQFDVRDNKQLEPAAPAQYKGSDVSTDELLMSEEMLRDAIGQRVISTDEELGVVTYRTPWENCRISRPYMQLSEGPLEAFRVKQWFHRRAGKYKQFWQPTFEADLLILNNGGITTKLIIKEEGYLQHSKNRKHLAFETVQGLWLFREVTSSISMGNGTMELTINSSLAIPANNIKRVSYLLLRRLDSDLINFRWLGGDIMQVNVSMVELKI